MRQVKLLVPWLTGIVVLAALLTYLDGKGFSLEGWAAYSLLSGIALAILLLAWKSLGEEMRPRWLGIALAAAIFLRMGFALFTSNALPVVGYDTPIQKAGHLFRDSFKRDEQAWTFALEDEPLINVLTEPLRSDQYGGLLLLSAGIYRVTALEVHRPLLVVVLTATVSAIAVLYTWGFTRKVFGEKAGQIAAWVVVLFPEAILLGASQMREAFLGTAFALALFGYALIRDGKTRAGALAIAVAILVLGVPFSPPFALLTLIAILIAWIWEGKANLRRTFLVVLPVLAFSIVILGLVINAWQEADYVWGNSFEVLVRWFENAGQQWRLNVASEKSGVIDHIFGLTPDWAHLPLVVAYGLVQPFLPASIVAGGAPIWHGIAIWRGLGWFALLPFLLYAPLASLKARGWRSLEFYLSMFIWIMAIVASYRAPGYQWDNPRYRAIFLAAQAAIAGWAWVHARRTQSPWLRRMGILVAGVSLLFLQWYFGRVALTPSLSLPLTFAAIILFILIVLVLWIASDFRGRARAAP